MEDIELNCKESGESSKLLGKKDESSEMDNLQPGGTQNELLLEVTVDHTGNTPSSENDERIFEVVERGDYKELSKLLTSDTTCVSAIDSKGNTALHCAVALACREDDSDDSLYQCIDLLMGCEQMQVNMPNKNGYTAIGLAVHHLHRTCVERMLQHPSANRLYLDYYPGDSESTVREIIAQKYPDLQPPLPPRLMESLDSSERDKKLLAALQHDKYNIFIKTFESNNPNPWYDEPYHSSLLEIACQMKNRQQFVELLLDKGADPNILNPFTDMPLLYVTARRGNLEVVQLLTKTAGEDIFQKDEKRTILHWLAGVSERKQGDKEYIEKCLKFFLESNYIQKEDIDYRDRWENTALYIAVESGFRDRAKLLLSKGADVRVFESGSKNLKDSVSIVKEILDDCLQSNDKPLTKDLRLTLNYKPFMNIVPRVAESENHSDLLRHPVMSAFLTLRWNKLRFLYISYLAFYLVFLFALTAYILLSEPYNTVNDGGVANNTTDSSSFNDSNITSGMNDSNIISQTNRSNQFNLWLSLMVLLILLTAVGGLFVYIHGWVYLLSLQNWLVILLIIFTFISCSGVLDGTKLKHHFSALALFVGWVAFLLMLSRLPELAVPHKMFTRVSWNFLKFMAAYIPLLLAFALSFYILFKDSVKEAGTENVPRPLHSLLKTIIMFSGELETSDLIFHTFPYTSHVIFLLFVVLVAIILLNLLIGLAVNDIGEIRKVAERLSLQSRVRLMSRIEGVVNALPQRLKTYIELKEDEYVIKPNHRNIFKSTQIRSLLSIIKEKAKSNEEYARKTTENQEELRKFTEKLSDLQFRQEEQDKKLEQSQQILMQIHPHLGIGNITRAEV